MMKAQPYTLIHLKRVSSTQDWLREWAQMGAQEGLALLADEQYAGRGRLSRRWESPPGGLYLSILLKPEIPLALASRLTMLVSLAAIDACEAIAHIRPTPKWPNDLLAQGKKLAGVLTELHGSGSHLEFAIIGLGMNVNNDFTQSPLHDTAISLKMLTNQRQDVNMLARTFLDALFLRYHTFMRGESPHMEWAQRLEPVGRRVRVEHPPRAPLEGLVTGVSPDGALLIIDDAGQEHAIWAGDIIPM